MPDTNVRSTGGTHQRMRLVFLLTATCCGISIGSYVSAELLYLHYPHETRTISAVASNTLAAVASSPLAMSLGIFPSIGIYGSHGVFVVPGFFIAIAGSVTYYRKPTKIAFIAVVIGFALWSHNNYLSHAALMSV